MGSARELPVKAYAVMENDERTGGIIFAKHAIVARRLGANAYADGELGYVTCNRVPWADRFSDTAVVPASVMVAHGWWFECTGCGRKISDDLPNLWEYEAERAEPTKVPHLLYARWKPGHVIGTQHGAVFCRRACQKRHIAHEKERVRRQDGAIAAFKRLIRTRFPDAVIPEPEPNPAMPNWRAPHHAYATKRRGVWRIEQIRVSFEFPGMKIGFASLDYGWRSHDGREARMPAYHCCYGDKDVFEAWAAGSKEPADA